MLAFCLRPNCRRVGGGSQQVLQQGVNLGLVQRFQPQFNHLVRGRHGTQDIGIDCADPVCLTAGQSESRPSHVDQPSANGVQRCVASIRARTHLVESVYEYRLAGGQDGRGMGNELACTLV